MTDPRFARVAVVLVFVAAGSIAIPVVGLSPWHESSGRRLWGRAPGDSASGSAWQFAAEPSGMIILDIAVSLACPPYSGLGGLDQSVTITERSGTIGTLLDSVFQRAPRSWQYFTDGQFVVDARDGRWVEYQQRGATVGSPEGAERFVGVWDHIDGSGCSHRVELRKDGVCQTSGSDFVGSWTCAGPLLVIHPATPDDCGRFARQSPLIDNAVCGLFSAGRTYVGRDMLGRQIIGRRVGQSALTGGGRREAVDSAETLVVK